MAVRSRSPQTYNRFIDKGMRISSLMAAGGMGVISLMLFTPCVITNTAGATDESAATQSDEESTLSVSLPSEFSLDVVPTDGSTTTVSTGELKITKTNCGAYDVYLESGNNGNLVAANPDNTNVISGISATATLSSFAANTWGYAFGAEAPTEETSYQQVSASSDTAALSVDTCTNTADDTYQLSFATKVDDSLPADTYTGEVTVTVVAAPRFPTLSDITYMQEMTPCICAASQENETKRLIDSRDGKYYWVAKLADGNCWMTQNLELSFDEVTTLTPDDSDVSADWTPGISMYTAANEGSNDNTAIQAWNLGNYVWTTPKDYESCGRMNDLSECPSHFTEISVGMIAMEQENTTGMVIDGIAYDAHYTVGYYYSWDAATAGSGANIATSPATAPDSICPKGWLLPSTTKTSTFPAFSRLLRPYGLETIRSMGEYGVTRAPLYFIRNGDVIPYADGLANANDRANYWSNDIVGNDLSRADRFSFFGNTDVQTWWFTEARHNGYAVRCVAVSN